MHEILIEMHEILITQRFLGLQWVVVQLPGIRVIGNLTFFLLVFAYSVLWDSLFQNVVSESITSVNVIWGIPHTPPYTCSISTCVYVCLALIA